MCLLLSLGLGCCLGGSQGRGEDDGYHLCVYQEKNCERCAFFCNAVWERLVFACDSGSAFDVVSHHALLRPLIYNYLSQSLMLSLDIPSLRQQSNRGMHHDFPIKHRNCMTTPFPHTPPKYSFPRLVVFEQIQPCGTLLPVKDSIGLDRIRYLNSH